jgi:GT2 family glycosyltransferase
MNPEISVVIATHNGREQISYCLESLLGQQTNHAYEIVVVDDGSTENVAEVVQRYDHVRCIRQHKAGPAAARNHGVHEAKGEIILFIDDDCVARPDWIEKMVAPFQDPRVMGVKGSYVTEQKELVAQFVQLEYEEKYDKMALAEQVNLVDTHSGGFRAKIFQETGGFDENFRTASVEDRDFSFRLAQAGYRLVFAPEAKVRHTHVDSVDAYLRKKFKNGYWAVLTIMKSPRTISSTSDTPQTEKIQVLLATAFAAGMVLYGGRLVGITIPALVVAAFLLSAVPLTVRCMRRDLRLGLMAPFFIGCRACGLAAGLALGVIDWKLGRMISRNRRRDVVNRV